MNGQSLVSIRLVRIVQKTTWIVLRKQQNAAMPLVGSLRTRRLIYENWCMRKRWPCRLICSNKSMPGRREALDNHLKILFRLFNTWTIHILQTSTYNFLANHFWRIPLLHHLFGLTSFHKSIFGVNTPRVSLNLQGLQHSRWPKCGPPQFYASNVTWNSLDFSWEHPTVRLVMSSVRTAHSAQIRAVQGVNFSCMFTTFIHTEAWNLGNASSMVML